MSADNGYYVPHQSIWPIVGSIGLFVTMIGLANMLTGAWNASVLLVGATILLIMIFGWFGAVIKESEGGLYSQQVDRSFRWGMGWFIFSEIMFFAAFFGALFYARQFALPWMAGDAGRLVTHEFLWSGFEYVWPSSGPAELGGEFQPMGWWALPTINTLILITSSITLTLSHEAMRHNQRQKHINWLALTIALGVIFLGLQMYEYVHAYNDLNLRLETGIYGSTFYMLTGFHGLHVAIGAIVLTVILGRSLRGHFTAERHFGFEAAVWYWHFVDVVWLFLFICIYVL